MEKTPGKVYLLITGIIYTVVGVMGISQVLIFTGLFRDIRNFLRLFNDSEGFSRSIADGTVNMIDRILRGMAWLRDYFGATGTGNANSDYVFLGFLVCCFALVIGFSAISGREIGERAKRLITLGAMAYFANAVIVIIGGFILVEITVPAVLLAAVFLIAPIIYMAGACLNYVEHVKHVKKYSVYVSADNDSSEEH
jgi:hypothetical protein